jgi:hypothetical protein
MTECAVILNDRTRVQAAHALVDAPDGWSAVIKPSTRSLQQNALLHALFSDLSKRAQFHGRTLSAAQWKVLMISGHSVATGGGADIVPGIEGEFVNIRESSASMSIRRMNSLLEYVIAWCAMNNIRLPAGKGYEEYACQSH